MSQQQRTSVLFLIQAVVGSSEIMGMAMPPEHGDLLFRPQPFIWHALTFDLSLLSGWSRNDNAPTYSRLRRDLRRPQYVGF